MKNCKSDRPLSSSNAITIHYLAISIKNNFMYQSVCFICGMTNRLQNCIQGHISNIERIFHHNENNQLSLQQIDIGNLQYK